MGCRALIHLASFLPLSLACKPLASKPSYHPDRVQCAPLAFKFGANQKIGILNILVATYLAMSPDAEKGKWKFTPLNVFAQLYLCFYLPVPNSLPLKTASPRMRWHPMIWRQWGSRVSQLDCLQSLFSNNRDNYSPQWENLRLSKQWEAPTRNSGRRLFLTFLGIPAVSHSKSRRASSEGSRSFHRVSLSF